MILVFMLGIKTRKLQDYVNMGKHQLDIHLDEPTLDVDILNWMLIY